MFNLALKDLSQSLRLFPIWVFLAAKDLAGKYKRTLLGPLWLTLNSGIIICGMGTVWSYVLKINLKAYFPYLAAGITIWNLISSLVTDGVYVFFTYANIIKEIKLPYLSYIFLIVIKNFLIFFHNILVYIVVAVVFEVGISLTTLLVIPGLIMIFISAIFVCLFLGMICSRYADLGSSINSIFSLLFLITPIVWQPDLLSKKIFYISYFNPLTHLVSIVREPLLNKVPSIENYSMAGAFILLLAIITMLFFNKYQKRIIYWI